MVLASFTIFSGDNEAVGLLCIDFGDAITDLAIRTDIQANPDLFAIGRMRTTDGGLSSLNNENVLAMASLADTTNAFDAAGSLPSTTDTFTGYVSQIFANFAVQIQDASDRADFNESLLHELTENESSITGVNLDEELSQLLIFQNGFQASAKVLQTVDELMQFLIQQVS